MAPESPAGTTHHRSTLSRRLTRVRRPTSPRRAKKGGHAAEVLSSPAGLVRFFAHVPQRSIAGLLSFALRAWVGAVVSLLSPAYPPAFSAVKNRLSVAGGRSEIGRLPRFARNDMICANRRL